MIEGAWAVRYADGPLMSQYDSSHPDFFRSEGHPRGGEIPYRAIQWPRVTELVLESESAATTFAIPPAGEDRRWALKSRTFMVPAADAAVRCFLLCLERTDMPVDLARIETVIAATEHVTYWFPDGSSHECPHYDCPDVRRWIVDTITGNRTGLMPATHELQLEVAPTL